ncbi:MAG: hypothetical protein HC828_09285 [Blastochloris sp.]|nr:hypothetical protein [Blastochloris sp.]
MTATPTSTATVTPPSAPSVADNSPACAQVAQLAPDTPESAQISERLIQALQAQMEISDDVRVNEVLGLARLGEWVLFEASFTAELESAVFLGQDDTQRFEIVTIWGGIGTSEQVRTYLKETAPAAPPVLIDCAESQGILGSL